MQAARDTLRVLQRRAGALCLPQRAQGNRPVVIRPGEQGPGTRAACRDPSAHSVTRQPAGRAGCRCRTRSDAAGARRRAAERERRISAASSGRYRASGRQVPVICAPGCSCWAGKKTRSQAQRQVREADRAAAARLLISLAHLEAEQGRTEYGLTPPRPGRGHGRAERPGDPALSAWPAAHANVASQRGASVLRRSGAAARGVRRYEQYWPGCC